VLEAADVLQALSGKIRKRSIVCRLGGSRGNAHLQETRALALPGLLRELLDLRSRRLRLNGQRSPKDEREGREPTRRTSSRHR